MIAYGVWWGGCGVKTGLISGLRRTLGRGCSAAGVALRAVGGVWSACGVGGAWCGRVGGCCSSAVKVLELINNMAVPRPAPYSQLVTSADRNDLVPTQEKLEWVTPSISLMEAKDTAGSKKASVKERNKTLTGPS